LFKLLTIFDGVRLSAYWECERDFVNKKGGLVGIKKQRVCVFF
jgi:putative spore protein yabQ